MTSAVDIAGRQFGRLVAIRRNGSNTHGKAVWECLCECGVTLNVTANALLRGQKSCGCGRRTDELERFLRFLPSRPLDGCWPWAGSVRDGYGTFHPDNRRRTVRAHRYSYESFVGTIPEDHVVCHRCDNPPCCNPAHLFVGTQSDNIHDAITKGRFRAVRNGRQRVTPSEAFAMRTSTERTKVLAERYGVSRDHISRLRHAGKIRAEVSR